MSRGVIGRPLSLVAALVGTAALFGCSSSTSPGALTHAGLISRADAICKRANDQIVALQAPPAGAGLAGAVRVLDQVLAIANAEVTQLQRLAPPSGDQTAFHQYVHELVQGLAVSLRMRDALAANELSGYRRARAQLSALATASDKSSYQLGMAECEKTVAPEG
jgi:hypothetical protein